MKCLNLNNWRAVVLQLHLFPEKNKIRAFQPDLLLMLSFAGEAGPLGWRCSHEVIWGHKTIEFTGKVTAQMNSAGESYSAEMTVPLS